ncbi:hemerythrin domain-containing protein [Pseudogracilibacillus sp. ICA-222130]|uniref:hemerythrin domain-containing protein n=1 Tax=Pseudogracilibacillus sp. ICA-222130 TaxID=3134655 RepID=UPI0030C1B18E
MQFQTKDKALRILENEHRYLTYVMDEWHEIILHFEHDMYDETTGREAFQTLRKQLIAFIDPLKNHTEKEEKYFFPLLGQYIGLEQGPILSIEEEHAEIDAYIGHFLHHTRMSLDTLSLADMKALVKDAGEAFEVLTVHFVKEESVLFPMAERVMRETDKEKLLEQVNTLII